MYNEIKIYEWLLVLFSFGMMLIPFIKDRYEIKKILTFDIFEDLIRKNFNAPGYNELFISRNIEFLTTTEIAELLSRKYKNIEPTQSIRNRIGTALNNCGFRKISKRRGLNNPRYMWAVKRM
ncbi:MAG: hypothetical protein A2V66_03515 [Ignavibacteria bacterium RBG_13_36_8]|nr:MAG: hypothetical protein A2V66_03515 [Ignavibacteria bacterium RBG_13_36_8]